MNLFVNVIDVAFMVYTWLIIARIVLSWVKHNPYHPAARFVYDLTEPFLGIFRRIIPSVGMIDLSPIAAVLALQILRAVVLSLIGS
jgi:YggT family protein